jgi:ankyrin repeat protein
MRRCAFLGAVAVALALVPATARAWFDRMSDAEKAVYYDDAGWLGKLLDNGADPNGTGTLWFWDFGQSNVPLLEIAVVWKRPRTTALLVDHGADPNAGGALARAAAFSGRTVRLLLEHGGNVNAKDRSGATALHAAAAAGREDIIRLLIASGADIRLVDDRGVCPLQAAAAENHREAARLLASLGLPWTIDAAAALGENRRLAELLANPRTKAPFAIDPLRAAVEHGHVEAARLLLEHGRPRGPEPPDPPDLLRRAISAGDVRMVRVLLDHGADADAASGDASSYSRPLIQAAGDGRRSIVRLLLERGADINREGEDHTTALTEAIKNGHAAIARVLLDHGADPNAGQGFLHDGPLSCAVERDSPDMVKLLLQHGAKVRPETPRWHLHGAGPEVVQALLDAGLDVNTRFEDGTTLLHLAERQSVARLLLDGGADVHARTKEGLSPVDCTWDRSIARLLIDRGADWSPWPAVLLGNLDELRGSLAGGAQMGAVPPHGLPLLHFAARYGANAEAIRLLAEAGGDVNGPAERRDGTTPLLEAIQADRSDSVRVLLACGADPNRSNEEGGQAPLCLAVARGLEGVVTQLLDSGADPNAADKMGSTALHITARPPGRRMQGGGPIPGLGGDGPRRVRIAALLLQRGANANAVDDYKETPLHEAACSGRANIARLLIDHGADVNQRDCGGRTPLRLAEFHRHGVVASLLRQHEAEK